MTIPSDEDPTAGQEMFKNVKPQEYPTPPNDRFHSDAWLNGWRDGIDQKHKVFISSSLEVKEYIDGFNAGVQWLVEDGRISINLARELIGLSPVEPAEPAYDAVKIPSHYNSGTIEVANFIADQGLDYVSGNVVKYVARAGKKDPAKEIEDLEKAAAYLQMRHNLANGLPAVVRDPETKEVVWSLFRN